MGGGILPIAVYQNKVYFLFGRENNSKREWSDFGGAREKKETYKETAIREGWEETSGILGTKNKIKWLINNRLVGSIEMEGYKTYIVEIKYNKDLPQKFRDKFLKIKNNKPELQFKNGLYEKDMIRWVELRNVKKFSYKFRRFYKKFTRYIIKTGEHLLTTA